MTVHEGPGVLPGRYAGGPIVLHAGPTPQQEQVAAERAAADALAGRVCAAAAAAARSECELLELVGEFDASGAVRWWTDVKTVAHWLAWACSMTPGVAREHVRVARALRRMPEVRSAFREGRLSYSKVREVTRVVDVVDDAQLVELALTATASQLARTVGAFRAADGTRIQQQAKRAVTWQTRADGMLEVRTVLPTEEGAVVVAALAAARDQFGCPPAKSGPGETGEVSATPAYTQADALLDVARAFLDAATEDRSGEDRRLVVVHVAADQLGTGGARSAACPEDVPAGTSETESKGGDLSGDVPAGRPETESEGGDLSWDVPAGTSPGAGTSDPTCHVEGVGPVEPGTAQRLACDADLLGAVVDAHGDVLALGRTRRLVSRAQRRALMIRDGMCQFPGCHQTRHLDAHHRVPWSEGGPTDLDNLVLLCQFHHTAVHEGRMSIRRTTGDRLAWRFVMPDGTPHRPWWDAETLARLLAEHAARPANVPRTATVTSFADAAARTIRPRWAGERFDLHACVEALFAMRLPDHVQQAA